MAELRVCAALDLTRKIKQCGSRGGTCPSAP